MANVAEIILFGVPLLCSVLYSFNESIDRHLDLEDLGNEYIGCCLRSSRLVQFLGGHADVGGGRWLRLEPQVAALGNCAGEVICLNEPPELLY